MIVVAAVLSAGVLVLAFALAATRRERRRSRRQLDALRRDLERLQHAFARFTPSGLVEKIIDRGTDIAAEKRLVTVLFADIKGFTRLTEQLEPQTLLGVLEGYFTVMSEAITARHGHVARYVGDGLMALFGALETDPWQVKDAVEAALAMREGLARYNRELAERGLPALAIGIGVNHGVAVAGVVGAAELLQYDVHGDVVNVASRVEGLTRTFDTDLLVTEAVERELHDGFITRRMPPAPVKGKSDPIITFTVEGPSS
jgi:adenylate cyclase